MDFEDVDINHVSTWGLTGAFGAQYYFSDRFSIGGEYGLRYLRWAPIPDRPLPHDQAKGQDLGEDVAPDFRANLDTRACGLTGCGGVWYKRGMSMWEALLVPTDIAVYAFRTATAGCQAPEIDISSP